MREGDAPRSQPSRATTPICLPSAEGPLHTLTRLPTHLAAQVPAELRAEPGQAIRLWRTHVTTDSTRWWCRSQPCACDRDEGEDDFFPLDH